MRKIALITLGCAKNLVDGEMVLAMFGNGYEITNDLKQADAIIVNTCAFIAAARNEAIGELKAARAANPKAKLVAIGCLPGLYGPLIERELGDIDLCVPLNEYGSLHKHLDSLFKEGEIRPLDPLKRVYSTGKHETYLRISEGCDHFCAFCRIPYIRGRYVSRPFAEILEEARILKKEGYKEINIISQDPAAYGKDFPKGPRFNDLLRALDQIGFGSIRLMYLYPSELDDEFLDIVSSSKSILHYLDIPVQSGSDAVLKAMNRTDTVEGNLSLIEKARQKMPDLVLRTTLIAGFPGEKEDDHEATLDFLRKARFDHVGVFAYSKEEGTAAAIRKNQVEDDTKLRRRREIYELSADISLEKNQERIGTSMHGFVLSCLGEDRYLVRCIYAAMDEIDGEVIVTSSRPLKEGEEVDFIIEKAFTHRLIGKAL